MAYDPAMQIRRHPRMDIIWPPLPQGPGADAEDLQPETQTIIREVRAGVDKSFTLSGEYKGKSFIYCVRTKHPFFAERLAAVFAKHVGETMKQLGDLDIDF